MSEPKTHQGSCHCGTAPDGSEMVAVNVRCLDGFDPKAITVQEFDGKSLPLD